MSLITMRTAPQCHLVMYLRQLLRTGVSILDETNNPTNSTLATTVFEIGDRAQGFVCFSRICNFQIPGKPFRKGHVPLPFHMFQNYIHPSNTCGASYWEGRG